MSEAKRMRSTLQDKIIRGIDFEHEDPEVVRLARAMHEEELGSWDAAGYQVKVAYVHAAEVALVVLKQWGFR